MTQALATRTPSLDIDLASAMPVDPYPSYERIRAAGPVVWNPGLNAWVVTSDRICREVFIDYADHVVDGTVQFSLFGEDAFITIDDKARHDALRGVWELTFKAYNLRRFQATLAELSDQLIAPMEARLRAGGTVEVIESFCRDLPVLVISDMMGIPHEMRPRIIAWSDLMLGTFAALNDTSHPAWIAGEAAKRELGDYLIGHIRRRRANPTDDLISQIAVSRLGETLSEEALMVNCRQLLFAGNETTAQWLAQSIVVLARHPSDRAAVAADPALLPGALEEVMRWAGTTHIVPRKVRKNLTLHGVDLARGDDLMMLVAAANRDPERYDHADMFDIRRREKKGHLSFGFGLHHCLGAALARFEAEVAMSRFLKAAPRYVLAEEPQYAGLMGRHPTAVNIRLH